jgi:hypothetical protein
MPGAKENGARARALRLPHRAPLVGVPAAIVVMMATLAGCGSAASEPIALDVESVSWKASAFCRETTCPPSAEWPQADQCAPADWAATCKAKGAWDVPLWWRTRCVGWSLQKDASARVTFDEAEAAGRAAFGAWTSASCAGGAPSIDVVEGAPVACAAAAYDPNGPNQNVVVFHDKTWPYDGGDRTIALTTTSFDPRTGEILDADIEINEATWQVGVHGEEYDLRSVLTHETGHFLGLAHSSTHASVMYPSDEGRVAKTTLTAEDAAGICAIYPVEGGRRVSTVVDASGAVAAGACDATPIGGFSTSCGR